MLKNVTLAGAHMDENPGHPWDFMAEALMPLEMQLIEQGLKGVMLDEAIREIATKIYLGIENGNITDPSEQKAYVQTEVGKVMLMYKQH